MKDELSIINNSISNYQSYNYNLSETCKENHTEPSSGGNVWRMYEIFESSSNASRYFPWASSAWKNKNITKLMEATLKHSCITNVVHSKEALYMPKIEMLETLPKLVRNMIWFSQQLLHLEESQHGNFRARCYKKVQQENVELPHHQCKRDRQ